MLVMPSSEVRRKRSSRRAAPSSMEYSVWTCRWTKSPPLVTDPDDMDGEVLLSGGRGQCQEVGQATARAGLAAPDDQLGEDRQTTRPPPASWQGAPTVGLPCDREGADRVDARSRRGCAAPTRPGVVLDRGLGRRG